MVDKETTQPRHIEFVSNVDSLKTKLDKMVGQVKSVNSKDGLESNQAQLQQLKSQRDALERAVSSVVTEAAKSGEEGLKNVVQRIAQLEDMEKTIAALEQEMAEKLVFMEGITTPEQAAKVVGILKNLTSQVREELSKPAVEQDLSVINNTQLKRNELQDILNEYHLRANASINSAPSTAGQAGEYKAVDDDTVAHAREVLDGSRVYRLGRYFSRLGAKTNITMLREWAVGQAKDKLKIEKRKEIREQQKEADKKIREADLGFNLDEVLAKKQENLSESDKNHLRGIILFLDKVEEPSFAFVNQYADVIKAAGVPDEASKVVAKLTKAIPVGENSTTLELKRKFSKIAIMLGLAEASSADTQSSDAETSSDAAGSSTADKTNNGETKAPTPEDPAAKKEARIAALETSLKIKRAATFAPDHAERAYNQLANSLQGTVDKGIVQEYVEEKGMLLLTRGEDRDLDLLESARDIINS